MARPSPQAANTPRRRARPAIVGRAAACRLPSVRRTPAGSATSLSLVVRSVLTPSAMHSTANTAPVSGSASCSSNSARHRARCRRALATQFQLPVVDLRTEHADVEAVALLDEETARGLGAVPLGACSDGSIAIAVADPDPAVRQQILEAAARPVTFFVSPPTDVRARDRHDLPGTDGRRGAGRRLRGDGRRPDPREQAGDETAADDAPVVQVVSMIIAQGLRDRASDIHIEPQRRPRSACATASTVRCTTS